MPNNNRVKELVFGALQQLHQSSTLPEAEQWFTRAQIARKLNTPSGRLNPARKNAMEQLWEEGKVFKRQKPDDARNLPEYSLYEPKN
jgi:hypothetical protein